MSLNDAIATQPMAIQIWIAWMGAIMMITPAVLLFYKPTRKDGVIVATATLANIVFMQWLFGQVGYVRLLGLPHILIWTPLAIYLFLLLRGDGVSGLARAITQVFLITICVSLAFDYVDVARWLLGERASLIPA